MSTNHQYFFVIFNIFTIFILCFCAICILFFIKFTLIFFLLPFSCSTCSAVPCFSCSICSTFPFFTIFSTIATVSAAISYPFAQSFCPFAVYKLVLFHFYFIHEKETPFLFRSSVSDICSSAWLSRQCNILAPLRLTWFAKREQLSLLNNEIYRWRATGLVGKFG